MNIEMKKAVDTMLRSRYNTDYDTLGDENITVYDSLEYFMDASAEYSEMKADFIRYAMAHPDMTVKEILTKHILNDSEVIVETVDQTIIIEVRMDGM